MHIDPNYKLRDVLGETILVKQGEMGLNLTSIISFNSSGKLLYEGLSNKEFSKDDVVSLLLKHYEVEQNVAEKDAEHWIESLRELHIIQDEV